MTGNPRRTPHRLAPLADRDTLPAPTLREALTGIAAGIGTIAAIVAVCAFWLWVLG